MLLKDPVEVKQFSKTHSLSETINFAITSSTLGDSTLDPTVAAAFQIAVVAQSRLLNDLSIRSLTRPAQQIDVMDTTGHFIQSATEGTAPSTTDNFTFSQVELTTKELIGATDVTRTFIEVAIEQGNLLQTLIDQLAPLIARDLEELVIYGDKDATFNSGAASTENWTASATDATFLKTPGWDGILASATKEKAYAGASPTISTGENIVVKMFEEMMELVDQKVLDSRPASQWRFYVSSRAERLYRRWLRNRTTNLGDQTILDSPTALTFEGVPIIPVPLMRHGDRQFSSKITNVTDAVFCYPQNFNLGFFREMEMDTEYQIRKRIFEITMTMRPGFLPTFNGYYSVANAVKL